MEEQRIEKAVKFVEILRDKFKEEHCEDCAGKEPTGDCSLSDSEIAECMAEAIALNHKAIKGFFKGLRDLTEKHEP